MPNITPRKISAGVAVTKFIERFGIARITAVSDDHFPISCERTSRPAVACGIDTIEHIDSGLNRPEKVEGCTDAHQITRLVIGHPWRNFTYNAFHFFSGFTNAHATDRVAIKTDCGDLLK